MRCLNRSGKARSSRYGLAIAQHVRGSWTLDAVGQLSVIESSNSDDFDLGYVSVRTHLSTAKGQRLHAPVEACVNVAAVLLSPKRKP